MTREFYKVPKKKKEKKSGEKTRVTQPCLSFFVFIIIRVRETKYKLIIIIIFVCGKTHLDCGSLLLLPLPPLHGCSKAGKGKINETNPKPSCLSCAVLCVF